MTQAVSQSQIEGFIREVSPFSKISLSALQQVMGKFKLLRYRIGQPILVREKLPAFVSIVYQGQVRQLGYDQRMQMPASLKLAGPGEILGWAGLVRGIGCETAIASTEVVCITLAAEDFLDLMRREQDFAEALQQSCSMSELFELLSLELQRRADGTVNLKELSAQVWEKNPTVVNLGPPKVQTKDLLSTLDPERIWLISSGSIGNYTTGSRLPLENLSPENRETLAIAGSSSLKGVRLLGLRLPPELPRTISTPVTAETPTQSNGSLALAQKASAIDTTQETKTAEISPLEEIPYGPDRPPELEQDPLAPVPKFPFVRGSGPINAPLACFHMLSKHTGSKFRRDILEKILKDQLNRTGQISMQACGAIAEMMGMRAQLVEVPVSSVNRVKAPALIQWQDSFAILYQITEKNMVMAVPERGLIKKRAGDFAEIWGDRGQVLLIQPPPGEQREKFGFRWFIPAVQKYRGILTQVFIASFFVQLFSLANPLITQVIIDKVLVQRSPDTLDVLGALLLGVAIFEGLLTWLRTYLFVDTTNRIDLGLGAEVISHLLRLPLNYFDRRRVGELAGRINELENIRKFLTGTALTVVLDAVFSVVYIAVMFYYSWVLSLWALGVVPMLGLLTLFVSPIVRRQLRHKAERYADVQSYLVEVLGGIQTVKAQNIELKSRWQWQERYAKYISAGFKSVLTFSTAGALSGFLNKVSGLAILWVGAGLVLSTASSDNPFTLGKLIAFRIIAGYVTSPLLRLIQLWQNFQETALSIERLSDILDASPEADEANRNNIPMPDVQGSVTYEEVSFRFNTSGPLQLTNVNLEFPKGSFVGIVGQSGSGKSTLMKLLQRLYEPTSGRIKIDGYDISKVELYSLRRQIGVVLQDTLLFNGTVQDNISLTKPEATTDEIIEAAKIAVAHDFIMELPQGYNTVVGERGSSLSGGQRQRIAIARTVLQKPKLLILDEATSALDYDSERQVCNNLASAFTGETVFFITHRLSTVKNADIIIMMDKGSLAEQGTHDELMASKGRYYCLFQQQESQL